MTPEQFCYWLQGYFEIRYPDRQTIRYDLTVAQAQIIQDHLDLVFNKVTPNRKEVSKDVPTYCSGKVLPSDQSWVTPDESKPFANYPDPLRKTNEDRAKLGLSPLLC